MGKTLAKAIKDFREKSNITQFELSQKLGISQGHLSRVEKGFDVPRQLQYAITNLIGFRADDLGTEPEVIQDSGWRFSSIAFPQEQSGDRIQINNSSFPDRFAILHCDAAGSDDYARLMAEKLAVAFETAVAATCQTNLTAEYLYLSINNAIRNTRGFWKGQQSGFIVVGDKSGKSLSVINAGMPSPYIYRSKEKKIEERSEVKCPPLGEYRETKIPADYLIELKDGDVFFSFSDGFIGQFNATSSQDLLLNFQSISKAQKSDAEGISAKILKIFEKDMKNKPVEDNFSFLMITKSEKLGKE